MIAFSIGNVTLVSLTDVDVGLVVPYLKYSDYILRVLGTLPDTVTKPVSYIDFKLRASVGLRISEHGVIEFRRLSELYGNDIVSAGRTSSPYVATIAVSHTVQESLQHIVELPAKLTTFEARLEHRYDSPNAHGRSAMAFFMDALCHPRPARPGGGGHCWDNFVSAPQYGALDMASLNRTHLTVEWHRVFPKLFTIQRDLAPVRADIGRVLGALAADRRVPVEHVRKVLGVKS